MLDVLLGEVVNCPLVVIAWVRTRCFQHELDPQRLPAVANCSPPKGDCDFQKRMGDFLLISQTPLADAYSTHPHRPSGRLRPLELSLSSSKASNTDRSFLGNWRSCTLLISIHLDTFRRWTLLTQIKGNFESRGDCLLLMTLTAWRCLVTAGIIGALVCYYWLIRDF